MEILNILFHALLIVMIIITLLCLIDAIKSLRLMSYNIIDKIAEKDWFINSKRIKIYTFLLLVCFSALMVVSALMFYPKPCEMQAIGLILAGLILGFAVIYLIASVKNRF